LELAFYFKLSFQPSSSSFLKVKLFPLKSPVPILIKEKGVPGNCGIKKSDEKTLKSTEQYFSCCNIFEDTVHSEIPVLIFFSHF